MRPHEKTGQSDFLAKQCSGLDEINHSLQQVKKIIFKSKIRWGNKEKLQNSIMVDGGFSESW